MLTVTFINVGYGESILVTLDQPGAPPWTMLIDGGSADPEEYSGGTGRIPAAKFLARQGITAIDLLVATHIHEDHICGLEEIIARCAIRRFWHCYALPPNAVETFPSGQNSSQKKFRAALGSYVRLWQALERQGCPMELRYGLWESVPLAPGLQVDVLGPDPNLYADSVAYLDKIYAGNATREEMISLDQRLNQASMILRLHYAGKRILLPADNFLGMDAQRGYPHRLQADVFKTAHHGQPDSMDADLAKMIAPGWVITCSSSDRRYNSSSPQTYQVFRQALAGREPRYLFSDAVSLPEWAPFAGSRAGVEISVAPDGSIAAAYR